MAEILARFKSEMKPLITYFQTFSELITSVSDNIASISGQYTEYLANTSGLWKEKYDDNNP